MKKKHLLTFIILSALLLMPNVGKAVEVTIGDNGTTNSQVLPIALQGTSEFMPKYSISQEIYLAEELLDNGAFAGDITTIKYYYPYAYNSTENRNLQVWIMESDLDEFSMTADDPGQFVYDAEYKAGTLVYQGTQTLAKDDYTITFNKNGNKFHWNGSKNIIITVYDETGTGCAVNRHRLMATSAPRFLHQTTYNSSPSWNMSDLRNTAAKSSKASSDQSEITGHKYVNKITFTFVSSETVPAIPDDLAVSSTTASSASLAWSSVSGAISYDLQQSANGENWSTLASGVTSTSYNWTGLSAASTQYARIRATNAVGSSDWSNAVIVTTDAIHEHNGITFSKWTSTTSMPASGNYYLANNVTYDFYEGGYLDLAGDLNLCLNGHTINLGTKSINVTNGKTMTIFDPIGGGKITGFVPGHAGSVDYKGVISVENNGTLALREGEVENTYPDDNPEYKSIAIAVGGTLILSGAPIISSNEMDIYLPPTIPAKVITIQSGKPLTNTTPYKVYKESGVLTAGWANMSGADPNDYFVSANPGKSICLSEGEAALQTLLNLSETALNSSINSNDGQVVDVNLTRPLTSSQYNTFCLPFALSNAQLEEYFGAGYELWELESSSLDGEQLSLAFERKYALEAGKPYLLQPASDVSSVMFFDDVTIVKTLSNTETEYVDFKGVYGTTEIEDGNRNLLFLGAGNELFWPEGSTGNFKGFRAYFEVKGAAAKGAKRARIVKKEDAATGIENQKSEIKNQKFLKDGQLLIRRDNKTYNVLGMEYGNGK